MKNLFLALKSPLNILSYFFSFNMNILFKIGFIFLAIFVFSCKVKQELAAPAPAAQADKFIGHWKKAVIIYNTNIEYIIAKKDTTYLVNEIISCKGDDCSQVKPSNLTYNSFFDKTKLHLKVFKEGKYQPFIVDDVSGWLYVDAFSYIKIK